MKKIPQKDHKYRLTYFDIRWLGEGARLLFHQAGVPFEDIRVSQEDWPKMKSTTPFGQLPLLEVDGETIAQSAAIYRFLGRQFGLVPTCPIEEALVDAVYDAHKDFLSEARDFLYVSSGFKPGDKDKLHKEEMIPARDKYFAALEKFLKKSGGEYLVGKKVSWADIVISDNLYVIEKNMPTLFDGHPAVKKFADHIHELPNIKKYCSDRPESHF